MIERIDDLHRPRVAHDCAGISNVVRQAERLATARLLTEIDLDALNVQHCATARREIDQHQAERQEPYERNRWNHNLCSPCVRPAKILARCEQQYGGNNPDKGDGGQRRAFAMRPKPFSCIHEASFPNSTTVSSMPVI